MMTAIAVTKVTAAMTAAMTAVTAEMTAEIAEIAMTQVIVAVMTTRPVWQPYQIFLFKLFAWNPWKIHWIRYSVVKCPTMNGGHVCSRL